MANAKQCVLLAPNELVPFNSKFITYPMLGSDKLDGFRLFIRQGKLLSRSGKEYENRYLPAYLKEIMEFGIKNKLVFDGELYDHVAFSKLQSMFRSHYAPISPSVRFHIFDMLTLDEWDSGREPFFH